MKYNINTKLQNGFTACGTVCMEIQYARYNFDADSLIQSQVGTLLSIGSLLNL